MNPKNRPVKYCVIAEVLASRLIDAWCADKGKQIPWAKAVQIIAIVTKQADAERDKLLKMGDEDGSCGMCGRSDAAPPDFQAEIARLRACLQWYADGHHYLFSPDWEEEEGWLCPPNEESWMVEPGHVAKAVLNGWEMNPTGEDDNFIVRDPLAARKEG